MRKSPSLIDVYSNKLGDFVKFLGLLGTYKISDFRKFFDAWIFKVRNIKCVPIWCQKNIRCACRKKGNALNDNSY